MKIYKHNFQIIFSLSAVVGESFPNKPFCLFLVNLKAIDIHFLNVSEKTQSVLGEFYEPVFREISLATLYIALPICHCNEIDNSPDIHFLGVCLSLSVGICWFL